MKYMENGPADSQIRLVLAHGAGAPMDSPFMEFFAAKIGDAGIHVVRFEFPYMQIRREQGGKRPPDRQPKLLDHWQDVVAEWAFEGTLVIGGKSMGGRMASLIADDMGVSGVLCLGYPFYAMGKQDKPRIEHLMDIKVPARIIQGERDTMGNKEIVSGFELSPAVTIDWLVDGDHSFKPRKSSGRTEEQNWSEGCDKSIAFIQSLSR